MQRRFPFKIFKKWDLIGASFFTIYASDFIIEIFDLIRIVINIVQCSFSLRKNVENELPENVILHRADLVFIVFIAQGLCYLPVQVGETHINENFALLHFGIVDSIKLFIQIVVLVLFN